MKPNLDQFKRAILKSVFRLDTSKIWKQKCLSPKLTQNKNARLKICLHGRSECEKLTNPTRNKNSKSNV